MSEYDRAMAKKIIPIFLIIAMCPGIITAQQVIVSPDINMRNTQIYSVIGRIDETIMFFQDKASTKKVLLYNDKLELQSERDVNLLNNRALVLEVVNLDSLFGIIYGYREEDQQILAMSTFNKNAEPIDTTTLAIFEKEWRGLNFQVVSSEDGTKLGLYNVLNADQIKVVVVDVFTMETIMNAEYLIKQSNLQEELLDVQISNLGEFILMTEINNSRAQRERHLVNVFYLRPRSTDINHIQIPLSGLVCADIKLSINNLTKEIGIAGLCDERRNQESSLYIWIKGNPRMFNDVPVKIFEIDPQIIFEVYGEKRKSRLQNFVISDILWQDDGGGILVFEMQIDLNRRIASATNVNQSGFRAFGDYGGSTFGGWSDHYREDLVLVGINKLGESRWHQVFYKKQFSQNDGAMFSSYFSIITPSRVRIIYNDEIKNNSTVSEYIFDSNGNYKRTTVLSTEYQNLKLRFTEALQLSSTEILVPSQSTLALNLVKIDYTN